MGRLETEQLISQAKTLGKLEDQETRRGKLSAISTMVSLGCLGSIVGINILIGQNTLDPARMTIALASLVNIGYCTYNLCKIINIKNEIRDIKSNIVFSSLASNLMEDETVDYEKSKNTYTLSDDGELIVIPNTSASQIDIQK